MEDAIYGMEKIVATNTIDAALLQRCSLQEQKTLKQKKSGLMT